MATTPERSGHSVGVVTFSQAQQTLIQDLLEKAQIEHPPIQPYFESSHHEGVFVKNLENVQGDERDVILFSICYAPDQNGKLSMNFGPLNRSGGERRLNVAVTRAKHEVIVFSTLSSDQIDLSRTRAIGAAHLKAYLAYAERGTAALASHEESPDAETWEACFELEVATFLRGRGYRVHTQVGCSGYRIDLAVLSPLVEGRYVLGIECDGATYHRAATARDRDKLRQGVLIGLGWRLHRIWSTDWWRNRATAEAQLIEVIEAAVVADQAPETDASESAAKIMEAPANAAEETRNEAPAEEPAQPEVESAEPAAPPAQTSDSRERAYVHATLPALPPEADFYLPASQPLITEQIRALIQAEGPILESLLYKRLLSHWGFKRTGAQIQEILQNCMPGDLAKTEQAGINVYWPAELDPENYPYFRCSEEGAEKRKADEIPYIEYRNATLHVTESYGNLPEADMLRETAKCLGFTRLTAPLTRIIGEAIAP